jgi:nucleotide-binding universal stress UspA family protein
MKIILAVDGSEHAQAAVDFILNLPLPRYSNISAMAVAKAPDSPNHYALAQVLENVCEQLKPSGLEATSKLAFGHPAQEIIRFADEIKPNLIIMGAKGLRATLGILLGGVAQQVVEHANWPVLVIRPPYHKFAQILLILDGSPCSQNALAYMVQFPMPIDIQLSIMHVLPPPATEQEIITATWAAGVDAIAIRPTIREELERAQQEEEDSSKALLAQAVEKCREKYPRISAVVRRGDAASEILKYSTEHPVDLIVAGSRGLSAISGWLLGSVSRKIVHYANCSVLIVKGEHCTA